MPQPRQRNKKDKIATILKTSNDLFKKQGYAATTTNQIAAEAKVSIGLVYKYFPGGKPEIAKKLVESIRDEIVFEGLDAVTPLNAQVYLHDGLLRYIEGHRRVLSNIAAFEIASLEDEETRRFGGEIYSIGSGSVTSILRLVGCEDGEKVKAWGNILFHVIDSTIHRHVLNEGLVASDEELADVLTIMLISVFPELRGKEAQNTT